VQWNVDVIAVSEIHKLSVIVHFGSEVQMTHSPTVIVVQAVSKRNVSLLFRVNKCLFYGLSLSLMGFIPDPYKN